MSNATSFTVETLSLDETLEFGRKLAGALVSGDVVALVGDLGAGKTHLAQAIGAAFGVNPDDISSPTFVIIQEYDGDLPICHIDAYRLKDIDEFLELGADELLGADNLCLIEWADRVEDVLPSNQIRLTISATGESSRKIIVHAPVSREQMLKQKVFGSAESQSVDG